ncbi:MAG: DNA polymerase III subunit delta' [Gammaproteobacteria bacterium]|nr:DNA polymerase III subunit delta' [Gammaproteobacteria bacterium]
MTAPYPWLVMPWTQLVRAWRQSRLGHAHLLHGRAGFGKRAFARAFAGLLLCEATTDDRACGTCRGCTLFAAGNHPDFLPVAPLEEGKALTIDQIRELGGYYALRPHYRDLKITVIEAADSMNRAAGNALLKLLEEPPAGAIMLLIADRPSQLLPTIRSRCQQTVLDHGNAADIVEWLAAQDTSTPRDALLERLARAAGSPLFAQRLAEPAVSGAIDGLVNALGGVAVGKLSPLAAAARCADLPLDLLLDQVLRLCHETLLLKAGAPVPLAEYGRKPAPGLQRLADTVHSRAVGEFIQKAQDVKRLRLGPVTLREADLAAWLWFDWQAGTAATRRPSQR